MNQRGFSVWERIVADDGVEVGRVTLTGEPELLERTDWPIRLRAAFEDLLKHLEAAVNLDSLEEPDEYE